MANHALRRFQEVPCVGVVMRGRITLPDQHQEQDQLQCWPSHKVSRPSQTHRNSSCAMDAVRELKRKVPLLTL